MTLSEAEKTFILHGVQENFRIDGRNRDDYRPMELETDVISHAFGSARLRLANTDVVVTVKVEIDVPYPDKPTEGKIEFFIDCSANATPDFEGRGGEDLATEISNTLTAAYSSNNVFNYTKLCILKGRKCWKLFVDILILECGGNLYDAISIAVKAALWNTRIPLVKNVTIDGNNVDMNISDNLSDCIKLDVSTAPLMVRKLKEYNIYLHCLQHTADTFTNYVQVTLCKIGDNCVVDPTSAEEQCSQGALVVAISKGKFSTVLQTGGGSLHPLTLIEKLKVGAKVGSRLDEALSETLSKVKECGEMGFLN